MSSNICELLLLARSKRVRQSRAMKIALIILAILLAAFGLWFWLVPGPTKLNQLDRLWGKSRNVVETNIHYGHDGDAKQQYDVYRPKGFDADGNGKCAKRAPVLIFFHGGSWRDGDKDSYAFVGRAFAARGFVTVIADYRKSPKSVFPTFVADAASVIADIHRGLDARCGDPSRFYIMGHSAGAHIAMMTALDKQWLAREGLDPSIITGVIGLAGPYDFYPFTGEGAKAAMGKWPKPEETQPITYAHSDAPPLLLLSGDADTTVKPRNSKVLAEKITALGGKAQIKLYPGVGHSGIIMAVSRPFRSIASVIDDVVTFTKKP